MIPYGRQDITQADIDAVIEVLRSDWLTQGPKVPSFEKAVARYTGARCGTAVNSATSALHIACLALGVGPGDRVWTSPNTFVASANCALYCGAQIDFVDIDRRTYNMSLSALEDKLQMAEKQGRLPKVVIPVHFAGQPCEMDAIHDLSKKYGFKIIEDASHAIGAKFKEQNIGSCAWSDITVFSFHPVKIITTSEGGMALTNDAQLDKRMKRVRTHGITTDKALMDTRPDDEIWNYQQIELGFNYRMTDIQAALGINQLSRIEDFLKRRKEIANTYDGSLSRLPVTIPWQQSEALSSYHLYPIRIPMKSGKVQKKVYQELIDRGVAANLHYIPVHRHPFYERLGFKDGDFPEAERFHREAISVPMYPALQDQQQEEVVAVLREIFLG